MTTPHRAAASILRGYFAERGEEPPNIQAGEFLPRITMSRRGIWRSTDLVDTACRILNAATFDVDDLAENHLGVGLFIEPLHEYDALAGAPVFGLADTDAGEMKICERAERYLPLYRTTVAHELGHLVLHGPGLQNRTLAYSPRSKIRPPEEHEADEFMVALLAPDNVLTLGVALAAHQCDLHLADVLRRANTVWGCDRWRDAIFPALIDRMCLSREFLSVQMRKWGFFSQETVQYHKTYRLPNRWRA